MSGHLRGVPNLGERSVVMLREQRVLGSAQVELLAGGLTDDSCIAHLRIVDIVNGTAYYVPMNPRAISVLGDAVSDLQNMMNNTHRTEGSDDDGRD